jgi:hypothetical protein
MSVAAAVLSFAPRIPVPAEGALFDVRSQYPLKEILHKDQWPQVWQAIRRIVGEQVGAWDYRLKDRFVDDIGID